jgi:hypothetical protein
MARQLSIVSEMAPDGLVCRLSESRMIVGTIQWDGSARLWVARPEVNIDGCEPEMPFVSLLAAQYHILCCATEVAEDQLWLENEVPSPDGVRHNKIGDET